jgi:hypothetical protein
MERAKEKTIALFYARAPESFLCCPVMELSTGNVKRHLLRFIVRTSRMGGLCVPKRLHWGADIVDQIWLNEQGEWWGYVHTDKAMLTRRVCMLLQSEIFQGAEGVFYTDELPWPRASLKRYDYVRVKHFELLIQRIRESGIV